MATSDSNDIKIDFVVPWVDGADKKWLAKKNQYLDSTRKTDSGTNRYRDWETLRYWFRAVSANCPWVNKIYFITDDQIPEWMNVSNDKLVVTDHKDFIPEEYLPVFSSHPIELNLHRIKELSEHFVYFNDDFFVLKPVEKEFFFKNGLPCDNAILSPIIMENNTDMGQICASNMSVINRYFEKKDVMREKSKWYTLKYGKALLRTICLSPWHHIPGFYNDHLPQPFLKSTFETLWDKEGELLSEVSSHRFRDYKHDVNQWLFRYWQFCEGKFVPATPTRGKCFSDVCDEAIDAVRKQRYQLICINDSDEQDFERHKKELLAAFDSVFPDKSSYEK